MWKTSICSEVQRFSCNNREWQQSVEICGLVDSADRKVPTNGQRFHHPYWFNWRTFLLMLPIGVKRKIIIAEQLRHNRAERKMKRRLQIQHIGF
jgi:hypothetical protein